MEKIRYPVFKAPYVSIRPQSSMRDDSAPRSKVIWGMPLSMAIGIGGRTGAGTGSCVENNLKWRRQKRAFFREDREDGAGGSRAG